MRKHSFIRIAIVAVIPWIMIYAYITVLTREIWAAFGYAKLEAMSELEAAERHWESLK